MTGVIYGVIFALWAAVLIPVLVKRHDSKRIDQAKAMESLRHLTESEARTDARTDARSEARPGGVIEVNPRTRRDRRERAIEIAVTAAPITSRRAAAQAASRRAARRRRTILVLLVLATAGIGVASYLGHLPVWAAAIPGALLLGFLLLAVVAASSRRRARAAARRRSDRSRSRARATRGRASVRPASAYAPSVGVTDMEEDADLVEDDTWEPVPTTLPTYLAATGSDDAGVADWTAREMLEQAEAARARQSERQGERRVARAAELAALHRAAEEFFEPVTERRDRRAVGD